MRWRPTRGSGRLLVEELGIEPGESCERWSSRYCRQSPALDRIQQTAGRQPRATCLRSRRHSSDADRERRACVAGLRRHRLVTVRGSRRCRQDQAGGRGGAEAVARAACGSCVSTLTSRRTSCRSLRRHSTSPVVSRLLLDRLNGAETVLVLDNCEHLVVGGRELVERLLDAAPRLRILATSQVPLGLDGERRVPARAAERTRIGGPVRRTGRAMPDDSSCSTTTTTASVEEVCRSLDGLPLAIELAAARIRSLSVRDIARRLDDRFALLQDPPVTGRERRRALVRRDRVELRPALPRRPAWAVGALVLRRRRLAGGGRARARRARRSRRGGAGHDRSPGRPVAGQRRHRPRTARSATGCSTASAPMRATG